MPTDTPTPASPSATAPDTNAAQPASKIQIPTAKAAGTAASPEAKLLVKGDASKPTVHDVTPFQNVIHKITLNPAQALALLASLDSAAPEGKLAEKIQAQVGPNGELFLTITYKA